VIYKNGTAKHDDFTYPRQTLRSCSHHHRTLRAAANCRWDARSNIDTYVLSQDGRIIAEASMIADYYKRTR
jgi:hypothetical protein